MEKKSFINVDELMPQVTLEQAATFYRIALPELKRIGNETRTACFLNCGKEKETGDRALAIQQSDPSRKWKCHNYGCTHGGSLVSLCDLMKPGPHAGGRPRGQRFKEIAADLKAMADGLTGPEGTAPPAPRITQPSTETKVNIPLKDLDNERARTLTELDRKFVVDIAAMNPKASAYVRKRPFLTPEVCRAWRMGYLPRDVGGADKSGGSMRGKVVYGYLSPEGDILTWFGRNLNFEDEQAAWERTDKSGPAPAKFHFVKGFHRGVEVYGAHQLKAEGTEDKLAGLGLPLVEGQNDVIRLHTLGIPAVGLCSNQITREQALKIAGLAREYAGGVVTIMLDLDPEGENGIRQCLGYLSQLVAVRLAWSPKMYGGKFRGRQPESLRIDEWAEVDAFLRSGTAEGWSL